MLSTELHKAPLTGLSYDNEKYEELNTLSAKLFKATKEKNVLIEASSPHNTTVETVNVNHRKLVEKVKQIEEIKVKYNNVHEEAKNLEYSTPDPAGDEAGFDDFS